MHCSGRMLFIAAQKNAYIFYVWIVRESYNITRDITDRPRRNLEIV